MGRGHVLAGIDIGTQTVRTVVVVADEDETLRVVGVGESVSAGMRRGSVVDMEALASAIRASIEKAETMSNQKITNVTVSLGGTHTKTQLSKGVVAVGKADGEVSRDDINRVVQAAGEVSVPLNNEIIHVVPRSYRLDDQSDIKNPVGMKGVRLEVEAMIIEGFSPQIKSVTKCLQFSGVEPESFVFAPLAAAQSVLDKRQQELGVVVVDIGASGTGVAVYEESDLIHSAVLPIGAGHITNDIAIGVRTTIDLAEKIKLLYGSAFPEDIDPEEDIDLSTIDPAEYEAVSRKHIAEIIEARMEEIFDAVNKELKSIHREGLLPAGVVLVGGGAKLPGIVEFAKTQLRLPVTVGYPKEMKGLLDKVDDPAFATATGLVRWHWDFDESGSGGGFSGGMSSMFDFAKPALHWVKKFLP